MHSRLVIAAGLFAATLALYAPVRHFELVNFDDPEYVSANPTVRAGLTAHGVRWAFTEVHAANWHPVTWLSHMLDCQLFGLDAAAHHLMSAVLHALSAALLFWVLNTMTAMPWCSAFAAALFAWHPLRVESVAWVAERKDVLSTLLWVATLWAYVRYTQRRSARRYGLLVAAFALGLMAKPMLVTLPFVLLLLDVWPLRRVSVGGAAIRPLLVEKLPLFALAGAVSVITWLVQARGGAVLSLDRLTPAERLANALYSYAWYLGKTVWPSGLSVFYPLAPLPWTQLAVAAAVVLAISVVVARAAPRAPYLAVGWLWYLGTLVPVIGLIKAGEQARADRFTYVPMIGIAIIVAWGFADLAARWKSAASLTAAAAAVALVACGALTARQLHFWHDSTALFQRALAVTHDNYVAHTNLGQVLMAQGRVGDALEHFSAAIRIKPAFAKGHANEGAALAALGQQQDARAAYAESLRLDPNQATTHLNLALLLAQQGESEAAVVEYGEALRIDPGYAKAHLGLGVALAASGKVNDAVVQYREALRLDPESPAAHNQLALALESSGRREQALVHYAEVARLAPDDPRGHYNLAAVLDEQGRTEEAIEHYRIALRNGQLPEAEYALGSALGRTGRRDEAVGHVRAALQARPGWPAAEALLASLQAQPPGVSR